MEDKLGRQRDQGQKKLEELIRVLSLGWLGGRWLGNWV